MGNWPSKLSAVHRLICLKREWNWASSIVFKSANCMTAFGSEGPTCQVRKTERKQEPVLTFCWKNHYFIAFIKANSNQTVPSIWAIQAAKNKITHRCNSSLKTEVMGSHLISVIIHAKRKGKAEYQRLLYHQLRIQHIVLRGYLSSWTFVGVFKLIHTSGLSSTANMSYCRHSWYLLENDCNPSLSLPSFLKLWLKKKVDET